MSFLSDFLSKPYPGQNKQEVERLIDELVRIGRTEDFLSEHSGMGFNTDCRHIRCREIGTRLNEIGGLALMEYSSRQIKRKLGKQLSSHLEYAWTDIGSWIS